MNKEFFKRNRKELLGGLSDNSITVLFSGDSPFKSADYKYRFEPSRNFYYITGFERENAIYMVLKENGKIIEHFYIERQDPEMIKWIGKKPTIEESKEITGIENVKYNDQFKEDFSRIGRVTSCCYETVYLDLEKREYDSMPTKSNEFAIELMKKYPYLKVKNVYGKIAELRVVKKPEEIELIKKAIEITKEGIYSIFKNSKEEISECELEAHFDYELRKRGIRHTAFDTIIGSGINGTILHYVENNCKIEKNSLVLLDLGAQYKLYNGDISRTFPANGKFTERQKEVYNAVLSAMKKVEATAKAGIKMSDLEKVAMDELGNGCVKLGLIKDKSEVRKYYFHSIGHYLGLDTHDVGSYDRVLEEGTVITNEPGIYIEEEGIGVRIEDDLLITKEGCINLSKDIIKEVEEIEEFMAENKQ
ncbi:aminopeptidase P family protein [Clostridium senegalense]|uniref:aminopeptidase P family protein n=1 Tax=Clostridium senegalense TaxID=1465809 RepID=UPI0002883EFA|nr:aminopeptidase P family protein [Clostridium senegalense]